MLNLSEEQLRKIEENKKAAILKKQQAIQKQINASTSYNRNASNDYGRQKGFGNNLNNSPVKVEFNGKVPTKFITAVCKVFGDNRFLVDMPYHSPSIDLFKTINGRKYETDLKKWSFPLCEQAALVPKLKALSSDIVVNAIPDAVIRGLLEPMSEDSGYVCWNKIDKKLRDFLMPFQVDGIKFGISRKGRCLIADDMGLGKTIQALGIAHYFMENWPLLIICPSSMRYPWEEAIKNFLPSVDAKIQVLTSGKDQYLDGDIVISSYDLMKNCHDDLLKKRYNAIIFDESHFLKSSKSIRTKIALQLASTAKNVILLSGTPALSRPQELYSQIYAIDPYTFKSFFEFGMRYCDGKKEKYGWNFSGASNLEELEIFLRKKIMIRRLKSEVIKQLPSKMRKIVILHPNMVKSVTKQIQRMEVEYASQKGADKHSTLLHYYALTGNAKLDAVCEYIEDKLDSENKFLIFAHHERVMDGITKLLEKKRVDFIRIDGKVSPEMRKTYCDRFQNEDACRIAVLSIKAANCGITLTAAQLVIFAELYWNPGELTQAEDRAHRIGQQDSVLVEYLIAKGTADEHLWALIESKLNTLNKVGLSKDSFKNSDTHHLEDPKQPKITDLLSENKTGNDVLDFSEEFTITEEEDDLFSNINLEELQTEYETNNKKRKTCTDCI